MTWVTCSPAGWGAGGSPGIRTSSSWLASKVICPCFLAASCIAKPEHTDWFNSFVPKPHARVSQDAGSQSSINDQNNAGSHPLGICKCLWVWSLLHHQSIPSVLQLRCSWRLRACLVMACMYTTGCWLPVAIDPPLQPKLQYREGVLLCG